MDLAIERRAAEGSPGDAAVTLVLRGRIDSETCAALEEAVEEELRRGSATIRLDLADVPFLSSAGIRSLFNVSRGAKNAGGSCLVSLASDPVRRVLTLARLAPLLMEQGTPAATPAPAAASPGPPPPARAERHGDLLLTEIDEAGVLPVEGRVVGSHEHGSGPPVLDATPRNVSRHTFGFGVGALADDGPALACGGELVAAAGSVFVRPPRPFGVPDSLVGSGDLVPAVRMVSGIFWEGTPRGRAAFASADDAGAVGLGRLVGTLLDRLRVDCLAVAVVAEVRGLVGVELIRPVGDSTPEDHPATGRADVTARWLSFSREPVHAGRTALVVGIATRRPGRVVRPLGGDGSTLGHFHAAVFPHRPLRAGAADPGTVVDDLGGSAPLAVMHLLADPEPVLGSGASEFVRGVCWYAPLDLRGGDA